ncbi:MAG: 50S ribosomal protein L5 [Kiritimatiellae bacterium]|nr:50S ribosomal protein L5 [Kiritimatiellia bacterium]MBO7299337.1 50S ribosomal protein L5 [Kiritimatiellia bacterium]MBQ2281414.1 50S ribosomal protein L5 [Kiritimatiellia bacterium]
MANLKQKYQEQVVPALIQKYGITNPMVVPKLEKIVVNMAFGIVDKDTQKSVIEDLTKITGQKPALCAARKSISNFKLREGMVIGAKVTLRGSRMYDFLDRFINIALPRIRDFRGVPNKGFDHRGNYTLGLKEQTIFPEIDLSRHGAPEQGMDITIVTTADTDEKAKELLTQLGMPFAGR